MIVWGGFDASGYLNTGGRYNPGTDSWTATSTTNAPDARYAHTAVWTGSEMIVWGGTDGSSFLNTGGRYNPGTDSWTATSTTNAPAARSVHTAVWTGTEMIVWGGFRQRRPLTLAGDTIPAPTVGQRPAPPTRPTAPDVSHRSVDWQRNDRLGRIQQQLFEHRRAILRTAAGTHADANSHSNSDRDCDDNTDRDAET